MSIIANGGKAVLLDINGNFQTIEPFTSLDDVLSNDWQMVSADKTNNDVKIGMSSKEIIFEIANEPATQLAIIP